MLQDFRLALRATRRNLGVFGVAALSLALGIGALTATWTTTDVLVVRPYPYDPEGSLMLVGTTYQRRGNEGSPTSVPDYLDLRARSRSMDVVAYRDFGANLGSDPAVWTSLRQVSGNFFQVVGVTPALGRGFTPSDEESGAPEVALLDHGLWKRRFGSDPAVLGRTILVNGEPATVVGVLPRGFRFSRGLPGVWLPLRVSADESRGARSVYVVGRLHDGNVDAARAELATLAQGFTAEYPDTWTDRGFVVGPLRSSTFGGAAQDQGINAILLASLAVMLIACANVANLLLARSADRTGELALRRALGGGWWRIGRQLVAESLVLAVAAGILGVALSVLGMRGIETLLPPALPRVGDIALDGRSALLAVLATTLSAVVFSLLPTVRALGSAKRTLPTVGRGSATRGAGGGRLRAALVAGEVALALMLVATTTLVVRSLSAMRGLDMGYETENVLTFDLNLPANAYGDEDAFRTATTTLQRALLGTPGVEAGGAGVGLPGRDWRTTPYRLPGSPPESDEDRTPTLPTRFASPGYLRTMGVRADRGRDFTEEDDEHAPDVALVNHLLARRLWPDADPLGRRIVLRGRDVQVVGMVPDVRELGPYGEAGVVYLPLAQWPSRNMSVVLRAPTRANDGEALARAVTAEVDPTLAPHDVSTLEDMLLLAAEQARALGKVLGVLAGVALVLALVGVFGSMAYSVARRVPEIGIRMALGADPERIHRMILRGALGVSAIGLAVGTLLSLGAARGITVFLYGVKAADPATFVTSALILAGVAVAAAWIPARRASRVDPMRSLRADG